MCYIGHRRFLPASNKRRRDKKNFDGTVDMREPLTPKSGNKILADVDMFSNSRKCKSREDKQGWKKKSVFFKLPYWSKLKLRHNIDIMHVVKNVTESLIATLFNIKNKTKDTWKSRKDLMDQDLKKNLHLQPDDNSFIMPMACYHLTKEEKRKILEVLKSLKFRMDLPRIYLDALKGGDFRLSRMKSHDFYVFIQQLLPLSIRGCLTKDSTCVVRTQQVFPEIMHTKYVPRCFRGTRGKNCSHIMYVGADISSIIL